MGATNEDLGHWAALLGHKGGRVVPGRRPDRFIGECACGYRTTNRINEREAVDSLIHHMYKVIREAKAKGWQPPAPAVGGRNTPSSKKMLPTA